MTRSLITYHLIPLNLLLQFLALFIAATSQDDVITAVFLMLGGYNRSLRNVFGEGPTKAKWTFTIVCLFVNGWLGLIASMILIINSSEVVTLLLNFTAVEFVSLLGEFRKAGQVAA